MNHDVFVDCISHAVLAPSSHNTQPWIFTVRTGEIGLHPDFGRRLPVVDPDDHALFISLGCALENLVVAAEYKEIHSTVAPYSGDAESGEVTVTMAPPEPAMASPASEANGKLFEAIPERQSTRRAFDGRPLTEATCAALHTAAENSLVTTWMISDREEIETVVDYVDAACRAQFEDRAFVAELMEWIRFSRREADERRDGLAAPAMGLPSVPRWFGQLFMRFAVTPGREAARVADQVRSSSALMVFSVTEDTPEAWIQAGRSFQRMALWATSAGVKHAHVNMPCEVAGVRERFRKAFELSGRPVLLIRLGYAEAMPASLRRPLMDVIRFEHDPPRPQVAPDTWGRAG